MTDGVDGAPRDESRRDRVDDPDPEAPADSPASPTHTSQTDSRASDSRDSEAKSAEGGPPTPRTHQSQAPGLGEPTQPRLARERARTSGLDQPVTEYTTDQRSLDSRVQIQWGVRITIMSVILGLIATAVLSNFGVPTQLALLSIGVLLLLGIIWIVLAYRIWVYQIREDSVYLERGVLTHVSTIVPYVRIQHVDTSRSALERALGLSTLVVYTAGSRGADVSIPGLQPEEARDLQQRLKELAIEADGDDAL